MSGTTESLSRKMSTAQDLAAVVRSMKALAASSIGQYERAVESLNDYYRSIELGLSTCLRRIAPTLDIAGEKQPRAPAIGAVLFGSDQGLVGRFNEVLMEFAMSKLKSLPGKLTQIWAVGERMQGLVIAAGPAAAGLAAPRLLSVPNSVEAITPLVGQILIDIGAARERGAVVEIHLFHNRPKSAATYDPVCKRLLPLDAAWRSDLCTVPWPTKNSPQIIDEAAPALEALIREYLFVLLFQACAESLASENASRLAAMQRAEKSIREMLEQLRGRFHRIRQESIDEELFEVIAGYESLSHPRQRPSRRVSG
jgi:F-type H+-transporting ATPase subunit gamma